MAGVVRLSGGRLIQKHFSYFSNQTYRKIIKLNQQLWLHTSSLLNVIGQPINMPSLSPTMTQGSIIQWLKKEGDIISPGDVLCEIETDKAVVAFETEEEGILAKILVKPGEKNVKVGSLIALMVPEGENWQEVEVPVVAAAGSNGSSSQNVGGGVASPPPGGGGGSSSSSGGAGGGSVPGTEVRMPSLSPTMTEGTIVSWLKKEGDKLNPGDALCEIQTDKAVMTFEIEEEAVLAKILVPANTAKVQIGTVIALTVEDGTDWKDIKVHGAGGAAAASIRADVAGTDAAPAFSGGSVPGTEVKMPSLSPTMAEGVIVNWLKKEGDKISPGDVLCEIQTDKAVMAFETEDEGVLAKILVQANSSPVKVGQVIALTVDEGADWKDVSIPVHGGPTAPAVVLPPAKAAPHAAVKPTVTPASTSGYHLEGDFAPAVRALLEKYHLTGNEMTPTGRKRKLLKGDVLKYISDNKLQPKAPMPVPLPGQKAAVGSSVAEMPRSSTRQKLVPGARKGPSTNFTDIEVTSMRRTIANRLSQSKSEIPHAYCSLQANIDTLLSTRKHLATLGIKVSVNDFVIKAVSYALKQCPYVNTLYVNDQVKPVKNVDISIAVATDSGLITPIVTDADVKSIDQVAADVSQLAAKARSNKLQPHEFMGGSFTISNLGMFGVSEFSAIINPPQCAILAVGGGRQLVKPDESATTVMTATLSYDSRAIAEDEVAAFMEALTTYLESPAVLVGNISKRPRVLLGGKQV